MAIDKNRTLDLLENIDQLFASVIGGLPREVQEFLKRSIMGPALDEIRRLVTESRAPVLYLIGRSGHGKSSVINALAGKPVSEVGDIKPTTPESIPYLISFDEVYSSWQVVDSRGIFETTRPDGAPARDAVELLKEDVRIRRPDVIMHVISAPEIRNLSNDLRVFHEISASLTEATGTAPPAIIVLNKADTLGNPREWPPETFPRKAGLIQEAGTYMADEVLRCPRVNLDRNSPLRGLSLQDPIYLGIIPVCSLPGEQWNLTTLSDFIGVHLPQNALLDFYQAQRRKEQLRRISSELIKRFAIIASGIGASPISFSDFIVLTPLQLLMISIIGGLSCRPVSKETAYEYLSAAGVNILAASGIRYVANQLIKLIPFAGWAAAGSIAGSSTYALGKAAEAYFFMGTHAKPTDFQVEWKNIKEIESRKP